MTEAQKAATEFKSWRKRQGLWTPELSHKADLVQFDLNALAKMERSIPAFNELVQKNLAEFQGMLQR